MQSVAASKVAGQANAVKGALLHSWVSPLPAPCFISLTAIQNANQSNIDIIINTT